MSNSAIFKNLSLVAAGTVAVILGTVASAHAATLGGKLFSTGGNVQVDVLSSSTAYTNELRLYSSPQDTVGQLISTNESFNWNQVFNLGSFATGQELLLGIFVRNTGRTYFMGEGSRNPDGVVHNYTDEIAPGVINVGFEDLFGGGDRDYNDVVFQFRGAVAQSVPEPTAALGLLAFGALGVASRIKRSQQKKA